MKGPDVMTVLEKHAYSSCSSLTLLFPLFWSLKALTLCVSGRRSLWLTCHEDFGVHSCMGSTSLTFHHIFVYCDSQKHIHDSQGALLLKWSISLPNQEDRTVTSGVRVSKGWVKWNVNMTQNIPHGFWVNKPKIKAFSPSGSWVRVWWSFPQEAVRLGGNSWFRQAEEPVTINHPWSLLWPWASHWIQRHLEIPSNSELRDQAPAFHSYKTQPICSS